MKYGRLKCEPIFFVDFISTFAENKFYEFLKTSKCQIIYIKKLVLKNVFFLTDLNSFIIYLRTFLN